MSQYVNDVDFFKKRVVCTKIDTYVFIFEYAMHAHTYGNNICQQQEFTLYNISESLQDSTNLYCLCKVHHSFCYQLLTEIK